MVIVVSANVFYHICQKTISPSANVVVSLVVTYCVALLISLMALPISLKGSPFVESLKELNWSSFALGFVIVAVEVGFLLAYRAGWKMSQTNIFANASVAILSIPLGFFLFKESLNLVNVVGVFFALLGIGLMLS